MRHRFYLLWPMFFISACNSESSSPQKTEDSTFKNEIIDLQAGKEELVKHNTELAKQLADLKQAGSASQKQLASQIEVLKSALEKNTVEGVALQEQLEKAKTELVTAGDGKTELEKKIAGLQKKLTEEAAETAEIKDKLSASLKVLSDPNTGLEALKKQIEINTATIAGLETERRTLIAQVGDLGKIRDEKTARVAELEKQIKGVNDKIIAVGATDVDALIGLKKGLEVERDRLKAERIQLEDELAASKRKLDDPDTGMDALRKQISDNAATITALQSDKDKLRAQLVELEAVRLKNTADSDILKKMLKDIEAELAKPGEDNPDLLKQVKSIKLSLADMEADKARLGASLEDTKLALAKTKTDAEAEKKALVKIIEGNKETIDKLAAKWEALFPVTPKPASDLSKEPRYDLCK